MEKKVNLLFPVEIISRELDFRLFLACLAARVNTRIWIGQPRAIYGLANCMQGGLYVGKNIFGLPPNITWHRYHNLKKRGFRFIHLDEEGAIYRGGAESWRQELRRRFDPVHLAAEDYVCTWGDFQRDFYRSLEPACRDNIRTTGHPRFDLYKSGYREYYEPEAAKLRERYGDFILINSNLHRVNHHNGLNRVFSERLGYYVGDGQKRTAFFERWQHLTHTLTSFVRLINRLSIEFPHLNIIVRPHPSENKSFYNVAFGEVPNIHAVREGSVGAWLFACRAMIHDGCTTGLEAHLADRPIINFKPVADEKHDSFIPNLFGARCSTEDQVVGHLRDLMNVASPGSDVAPELPADAYALLDNFRHESFPQLLAVIDEVVASMQPEDSSYAALRHSLQENVRRAESTLKAKLRPKSGEKLGKFSGLDKSDIERRFTLIQQVTGTRVKHTLHSNDLIAVEAAP
jgi:surface carbohydrate biosynthesis protein